MSSKLNVLAVLSALATLVSGCQQATPQPSPPILEPTPDVASELVPLPRVTPAGAEGVVFSEVLAGVSGDNNLEFIELYNASDQAYDLQGWSIWYRLATSAEDLFVHRWHESTLIPAGGHLLLVRDGKDVGTAADSTFGQALNTYSGGLELRKTDGAPVDRLGWGNNQVAFREGDPAPALENGISLERLPGSSAGNYVDADDNSSDFRLNPEPVPQNTGSPPTPLAPHRLVISAVAPAQVQPGSRFAYTLTVSNATGQDLQNVSAQFRIPEGLLLGTLPMQTSRTSDLSIEWRVGDLEAGGESDLTLPVQAPYSPFVARAHSYTATAEDWPHLAVGGPVLTQIEGGVIPIATAKGSPGTELTIEGVATMYTGGYFAGSGNTKFYVRDETGGLQVQVFGGENLVNVHIGDRVRVTGTMGVYRGAAQIVPSQVPDSVEILQRSQPGDEPGPVAVDLTDAATNFTDLPGQLVEAGGRVTRVEEFTYSYEIDLRDERGQVLELYVDKLTNISVEGIGEQAEYSMTGILEVRDGAIQLYPRVQSDLRQVFPPGLHITAFAPVNVAQGTVMTYTATVTNHAAEPATNVRIRTTLPGDGTALDTVSEGGRRQRRNLIWTIPRLEGNGGQGEIYFSIGVSDEATETITMPGFRVRSAEWLEITETGELRTFVGDTVPIWAVQGEGNSSPYVLQSLAVEGTVIGSFPELNGFFMQELTTDLEPATSAGLFINTEKLGEFPQVFSGDLVRVRGQVRETAGQTQLVLADPTDLEVLAQMADLPDAIELDPPETAADALAYYEALEGMLVQVTDAAWAASPTSQYGEYVVVLAKHGVKRLWQGEENGIAIMVDDGSTMAHEDRSTLPYVVEAGDEVKQLIGPLAYTFGRYKIEPLVGPEVSNAVRAVPTLPLTPEDAFSIMTWNVENLFDTSLPHPSDPPRPNQRAYRLKLDKIANTILSSGLPTIVGLQEVENLGILEDLVDHPLLREMNYRATLIEGSDSRGIDVGYLVSGEKARIVDIDQFDAPEGLTSRPPLLLEVEVSDGESSLLLHLLNNHFTSMSGGVEATEPRRTAQAAWNVQVLEDQILAENTDAYAVVLGDLNSFYLSPPLDTLQAAGLQHVMEMLPTDARYTYIYEGESQVLDHMLVTPNLYEHLAGVNILHSNADYPPAIPDDPSALRASDHDPVVATFTFKP